MSTRTARNIFACGVGLTRYSSTQTFIPALRLVGRENDVHHYQDEHGLDSTLISETIAKTTDELSAGEVAP
jgi:hypothetical protein